MAHLNTRNRIHKAIRLILIEDEETCNVEHVLQFQLFWSMFEQTLHHYIARGLWKMLKILVTEH